NISGAGKGGNSMMSHLSQSWMLFVTQFNWRSPGWLLLIPVVVLVAILWQYRVKPARNTLARMRRYADMDVWPMVVRGARAEDIDMPRTSRLLRDLAAWLGVILMLLALAGPRWRHENETVFRKGADIAVVMDVSRSMRVRDVHPDRLTREKQELHDFLLHLGGDRVALIAFAGRAFLMSPLTPDDGVVMRLARQTTPRMITDQGSDLAAGLSRAMEALKPARGHGRAIVLLTDGENVDQGALKQVTVRLARAHIPVFAMGVGTLTGGLVPAGDERFVHDAKGRVAKSRLHEQRLMAVARATGGTYARMQTDDSDWRALYDEGIARTITRTRVASRERLRWREAFAWVLLPGMLMLGLWWKSRIRVWRA
ncbi:MAG: VWA domain-containing protein, partial [Mariprofundaceae bacterium]|nr:VWA domain-containing protein [Mariprofundaceae bacterium]